MAIKSTRYVHMLVNIQMVNAMYDFKVFQLTKYEIYETYFVITLHLLFIDRALT